MPGIETRPLAGGGTRYVVRVRDPHPKPGRAGYTSATFATRPEAERFVRDCDDRGVAWALTDYKRAKDEADELTLDEWAEVHFDSLTKPAGATVRRYRSIYATTWSPHLGHMRLSHIERAHVAAALKQATGSDKTLRNKWAVLAHMLKMAAQDGKIPRSPAVGVEPPRRTEHETEEHRYLTEREFWRVVKATPPYWRPLVIFLAGSGVRWGEAAALTVGDVDLAAQVVRITKAEKQDPDNPSKRIVGPPKTKKGRRAIVLPDDVTDAIRPLIEGRKRTERVFLPPNGGPLRHRTFYRDIWQRKSMAGANLDGARPRLHDLRHSHVAWLLARGIHPAVIQARLGHEKITTTVDIYGHLMPDVQQAAASAAQQVFALKPPVR